MSYKDETSTVLVLCEQCWQSVVEPHLAGKLFYQGVEAQHTAATYSSHGLPFCYNIIPQILG